MHVGCVCPAEPSETSAEIRMAPRWLDTILEELYKSTDPADSKRRLENVLKAFEEAAVENYRDNSEVDRPLVMILLWKRWRW